MISRISGVSLGILHSQTGRALFFPAFQSMPRCAGQRGSEQLGVSFHFLPPTAQLPRPDSSRKMVTFLMQDGSPGKMA